jgi:hypothetical protein
VAAGTFNDYFFHSVILVKTPRPTNLPGISQPARLKHPYRLAKNDNLLGFVNDISTKIADRA